MENNLKTKYRTGLVYDEQFTKYYNQWQTDHTEIPDRARQSFSRCENHGLVERCKHIKARPATEKEMRVLHSDELVKKLESTKQMNEDELKHISQRYSYVYFHNESFNTARMALGSTIELVDQICTNSIQNGLAIVRPPGHHAMYNEFNGYCYLNNVATAAKLALEKHSLQRILIVDWDYHHGQGTQFAFYDDPRVLYFSVHGFDHGEEFPTLRESEYDYIGEGTGKGYNVNVALNERGCNDSDFLAVFLHVLLPIAYEFISGPTENINSSKSYEWPKVKSRAANKTEFNPDLVLVSAGYDSAMGCPEGQMELTPACFAHFVNLLSVLAEGKICLALEGGYCIESLAEGVALSLRALLGDPCPLILPTVQPKESVVISILNAIKMLRPYWKSLCYQGDLSEGKPAVYADIALDVPKSVQVLAKLNVNLAIHPLIQECHTDARDREALLKRLSEIIKNTDLRKATHKVGIIYDEKMLLHKNNGSGDFADVPERISRIHSRLKDKNLIEKCHALKSRRATEEELLLVHSDRYIRLLKRTATLDDEALLKLQTNIKSVYLCKDTYEASSYAVGSLLNIVDSVLSRQCQSGVGIIRPPGHHAKRTTMMGYCFLNNVAIAAKYAISKHGLKRILILDWDIHHGNGTQEAFYEDSRVLIVSLHRYDIGQFYPYDVDGGEKRVGYEDGEGYNVNIPWCDKKMGDSDYLAAFNEIVLPIAYEFGPELILVSAGFDALEGDPMGGYILTPQCYALMTKMLMGLANGRIILSLEGGYELEKTAEAMCQCVSVLLGDTCPRMDSVQPQTSSVQTMRKVLDIQKKYWKSLQFRVDLPS